MVGCLAAQVLDGIVELLALLFGGLEVFRGPDNGLVVATGTDEVGELQVEGLVGYRDGREDHGQDE